MTQEHMIKSIDEEYRHLNDLISRMGELVESQIGDAAHLGDQARELLEVGVEGLGGMFRNHVPSPQPNRPVM